MKREVRKNVLKSNLKDLLTMKRLSIREFSRMIDFRFETVRQLYNNEITRIPADLIERTCRELRITPGELFTITDEPKPSKETEKGMETK
jgi:DNA-binding Xre family transcriptional regulator